MHRLVQVLALIVFLFLIYSATKIWRVNRLMTFLVFTLTIFYLTMILQSGFGAPGKAHHYLIIYPIPHIVLSYYLIKAKNRLLLNSFIMIFIMLMVTSYYEFQKFSSLSCGEIAWSCNIRDAVKLLSKDNKEIVLGDWGLATQFLLLTQGKGNLNELVFKADASTPEQLAPTINELAKKCADFVLFTPELTSFLKARESIVSNLENYKYYQKQILNNRQGKPLLEIYRCK